MSEFNTSERRIARFFNRFPHLKSGLKRAYQFANYFLFKKKYSFRSVNEVQGLPISHGETFFGYYDKSPISKNNNLILYHYSESSTRNLPSPEHPISVCVWDLLNNREVYCGASLAYNWQQGAKSQWLSETTFIYNNFSEGLGYHAIKVELLDGTVNESIIPKPIYDCFNDKFALSLSFERLQQLRPDYGYRNHNLSSPLPDYSEDGIFYIDLQNGSFRLLLDLKEVINLGKNNIENKANHKVNHIMISPNGEHFMFLHRFYVDGRRFDRLIVSDLTGERLNVLADDEMVSHCYWMNNDEVIGYLRGFQSKDKYYRINIHNGKKEVFGEGVIDRFGDGHPSVHGNKIVFDTYPDKARMKALYLFDTSTLNLDRLGEFYESLRFYGETRCDLHPRFSWDGRKVFFDSVHSGKRALYWIEV